MLAAFCRIRLDSVTICEDWLGGFTRFFVRPAWSIILAVFMVALTHGGAVAQTATASDSSPATVKKTLIDAATSLEAYAGNGADIAEELRKVRQALDKIGLIQRQAFLKEQSIALTKWLDETQVIKSDAALITSLSALTNTADIFVALDRSQSAEQRAQRLLDVLGKVMLSPSDPAWNKLVEVLKKLEELEATRPIPALRRRAPLLMELVTNNAAGIEATPEIVKVLVELQTQINSVTSTVKPKVHIVSAVYGDLRDGADGARRCDATAVLVKNCERKDKCDIGELAVLCGYDPAPFAENRHKTLVLTYSCVSSVDNRYWNRLQRNREVSLNDSPITVRLHSNQGSVICNAVGQP